MDGRDEKDAEIAYLRGLGTAKTEDTVTMGILYDRKMILPKLGHYRGVEGVFTIDGFVYTEVVIIQGENVHWSKMHKDKLPFELIVFNVSLDDFEAVPLDMWT